MELVHAGGDATRQRPMCSQLVDWESGVAFDVDSKNVSRANHGFGNLHEESQVTNYWATCGLIETGIHGFSYCQSLVMENTLRAVISISNGKKDSPKQSTCFTGDTIMNQAPNKMGVGGFSPENQPWKMKSSWRSWILSLEASAQAHPETPSSTFADPSE